MTIMEKVGGVYFVSATAWSAWMYYQGLSFPMPTVVSLFMGGGSFLVLVLMPLSVIGKLKIMNEEAAVRKHILSQP